DGGDASDAHGPSHRQAIRRQQDDRADGGHDEPYRGTVPVPAEKTTQKAADQSSHDSEKSRDEEAAWIAPRHEELAHDPDDQPEQDPSDDVHRVVPLTETGASCRRNHSCRA